MKKSSSTYILILVFIIGLSLLLYPSVSDYWNSFHATRAVSNYSETVAKISDEDYNRIMNTAREYNIKATGPHALNKKEMEEYMSVLNIDGNGMMGYIEIPIIHLQLPIYHTVDDAVLQIAVGTLRGRRYPLAEQELMQFYRDTEVCRPQSCLQTLTE